MAEIREVKAVPIFLDNPVDFDSLGVDQLAYTIAGAAIGNPGPLTIGVFGGWGQGKTSVLQRSRKLLTGSDTWKNPVATVWFNAWQHEREDHPLFSLIAAIVDGLEREGDRLQKINHPIQSTAATGFKKAALTLRALTRGMKFSGKVGMPLVGEVGVDFDVSKALAAEELLGRQNHPLIGELLYHNAFDALGEVTQEFRAEMDKENSGVHANVVVFIDDLDRCNPERALHLLEGIKLILSQPGFVFVMGIDRTVIEEYLAHVYEEKYKVTDQNRGKRYLDKLIQLPLNLPSHRGAMGDHLGQLLERFEGRIAGLTDFEPVLKVVQSCREAIIAGAEGNPRSLVRLLNGFIVDCQLWQADKDYPLSEIAKALIFYRILEARLSGNELGMLVDHDLFWSIALNKGVQEFLKDRPTAEDAEDLDLRGMRRAERQVAKVIGRSSELTTMLKTGAKIYATDRRLRERIESLASRYGVGEARIPFSEGVWEEICIQLGVDSADLVTFEQLRSILKLDLVFTDAGDGDAKLIAQYLTGLTGLDVVGTAITDEGLRAVAESLTGLTWLDLGGTAITDEGLRAVAKKLTGLTWLDVVGTAITDEGLRAVAQNLTGLTRFCLGGEAITDEGLRAVAKKLTGLTWLGVVGTAITDEGLGAVAENLTGLTTLLLNGTAITDEGLRAVAENLTGLTDLYLGGTAITDEAVTEIRVMRPNLRVRR